MFGGHGPAIELRVFERLLNIKNQNDRIVQRCEKRLAVIGDVGKHGPASEPRIFERLLNMENQNERIIQHREKSSVVFGGARPSHEIDIC